MDSAALMGIEKLQQEIAAGTALEPKPSEPLGGEAGDDYLGFKKPAPPLMEKEKEHPGAKSRAPPLMMPETNELCIQRAEERHTEANGVFKDGDFKKSMMLYEEVLKMTEGTVFHGTDDDGAELVAKAIALRTKALLNLALCGLKLEKPDAERVIELCEEVLTRDPKNVNALFRSGKAHAELEKYYDADELLTRAVHADPQNATVRQELLAMRKRFRSDRKKANETFNGMFGRGQGFASEDRDNAEKATMSNDDKYECIVPPEKNTRAAADSPLAEADGHLQGGRLEAAIIAYEAALQQTAAKGDWSEHFAVYVKLARVYMDLDCEKQAMHALGMILDGSKWHPEAAAAHAAPTLLVRRSALLLKAACLLNEYVNDMFSEVGNSILAWTATYDAPCTDTAAMDVQLADWRKESSAGDARPAVVDVAVAHGLFLLASKRRDDACTAFAEAVAAPTSDQACFSDLAAPWNMLGAMLFANHQSGHALVAYQWSLNLKPHNPRCMVNRCYALAGLDRHADAAWSFAEALLISPVWAANPQWKGLQGAASKAGLESLQEAAERNSLDGVKELYNSNASSIALKADVPDAIPETLKLFGFGS